MTRITRAQTTSPEFSDGHKDRAKAALFRAYGSGWPGVEMRPGPVLSMSESGPECGAFEVDDEQIGKNLLTIGVPGFGLSSPNRKKIPDGASKTVAQEN
ncbi:hypothetical protein M2360_004293 [Rhizobium sp. SG_E_25_P2]|uniref:hypothetical protein n=1 Tax=Rhizobium sp. SG_E_25_P2 TaxID=2879942 RepID=UPI002473E156|nr:hypothetical protein [Rhizobium sp. SG_E_25_P2]MDH6268874.1 hypothetical protein [Rhizobium sp. SG_E_25_P2]